jgi:hypothetical protein
VEIADRDRRQIRMRKAGEAQRDGTDRNPNAFPTCCIMLNSVLAPLMRSWDSSEKLSALIVVNCTSATIRSRTGPR